MKNKNKVIFFSVISMLVVIAGLVYYSTREKNERDKQAEVQSIKLSQKQIDEVDESESEIVYEESEKSVIIKVHVTGKVKNPGVYEMEEGQRIEDALLRAGGFEEGADEVAVNLADYLFDTQQIVIPSIDEKLDNNGVIGQNNYVGEQNGKGAKININKATKDELMKLSGIGDALSDYIINYRENKGPFSTIDEIKKVPKIGDTIYDMIKDDITVE